MKLTSTRLLLAIAGSAFLAVSSAQAQVQTYLFDFGSDGTQTNAFAEPYWNNVTATLGRTPGGELSGIITTQGNSSNLKLQIISRFNTDNTNGTTGSTLYPTTATQDSLFGNSEVFNGLTDILPVFKLTQLDPTKTYDFTFYASRIGSGGQIRTTDYTVAGAITGVTKLNVAENVNNTASVFGIAPNGANEITISLTPSADNNNANHFTYLGVLQVVAVPEPSAALLLLSGVGLLGMRRRLA